MQLGGGDWETSQHRCRRQGASSAAEWGGPGARDLERLQDALPLRERARSPRSSEGSTRSTVSVLSGAGGEGGSRSSEPGKARPPRPLPPSTGAGVPLSKEVPTGQWDKSPGASSGSVRDHSGRPGGADAEL